MRLMDWIISNITIVKKIYERSIFGTYYPPSWTSSLLELKLPLGSSRVTYTGATLLHTKWREGFVLPSIFSHSPIFSRKIGSFINVVRCSWDVSRLKKCENVSTQFNIFLSMYKCRLKSNFKDKDQFDYIDFCQISNGWSFYYKRKHGQTLVQNWICPIFSSLMYVQVRRCTMFLLHYKFPSFLSWKVLALYFYYEKNIVSPLEN